MGKGDVEAGGDAYAGTDATEWAKLAGGDIAAKIAAAADSAPVVIFGKEHCPFCIEARRLFAQRLAVPTLDFNVDVLSNGSEIHDALKKKHSPQTTVPYIYINKVMVGGCDAVKRLQADGELNKMLSAAGVKVVVDAASNHAARHARSGVLESGSAAGGALFHFPECTDNRVLRLNSLWTVIICVFCAVFYKRSAAHWVMGGLMVEYVARVLGGGNASALGSLSGLLTAVMDLFGSKPTFAGGPPKQFAGLCGGMFAGLAFFFFLVSDHEGKLINVGLALTCVLGLCALLEAALYFCVACWMFGLAIRFGFMSDGVYTTFINSKVEAEYTHEEMNRRLNEGAPQILVKSFDDAHPLKVDYKYKNKTEEMTREDFHLIKHVKLTHFVMHLGFVGLACAWRAADPLSTGLGLPAAVWYSIGIASAIWYFTWVVLYLAKMAMYPKKVAKELNHNISGSCFALPWVVLVLFAFLENERDPAFAKVLFWIGAPVSLLLSIVWVGGWIAAKKELEHVNASWMMMPVANFVAAAVGPMLDSAYRDAMQLWFAFALLLWVALFAITLYKAFVMPDYDDRARPFLAIWVAAPAIGAIAYLSCYGPQSSAIAEGTGALGYGYNDFIFINLHWMAIAPYFGRVRFDMSYWAAGFPSAAMCMCAIYYNALKPGDLSEAIAYATLFFTSWLHAILLLQTLTALIRRQVFVPDYKWGPMSFMRLTHEALRGGGAKLLGLAKNVEGDESALGSLRATWEGVHLMHEEHGRHEDEVIFKAYNEFFPRLTKDADEQHLELEELGDKVGRLLSGGGDKLSGAAAQELTAAVESYVTALLAHLRFEEDHLQCMPRKYMPLGLAKQVIIKCWASTSPETWHTLLPLLVESMPMLQQRVRYIKTLLWCMPERCHLFGLILAAKLDAVNWRRISAELPEIIPRGVSMSWERYY
ncbi:Glutaredoxin-C6 [Tetrabaena socialis]|uniref:Glutaredoxin-C6 n=1 Tax=Tetrabaena socialis TaxID=47790 RepID=A0A2J8AAD0_9CHLO|nr:Glutaredoxin-C6 [Tetrabaena socialis]|eukprot:PNH09480.1 Glutaredoxin-C6 [Tetrabaena socialis]